jgi:hypothetical protein
MSQDESDLTRFELLQAKKAYIERLEKELDTGKHNDKEMEFLNQYLVNVRQEVKEKSSFTLEEAIEELGFCYDVGTRIRHIIARYISEGDVKKDYKSIHEMYLAWHMSPYFVFLNCKDINSHYIAIFQNAFNRNNSKIPTVKEQVDSMLGKVPAKPENDFRSINTGIDKLEELIFKLEEKQNLQTRQAIAKQEHDVTIKYELKYNNRELTFNGITLAKPDFMSENDQFLDFIFKDGNSWRNIPMDEILEALKVEKLGKTVHQILNDVGVKGVIKDVFMPNANSKGVELRNPITYGFAEENKLSAIDIKSIRNDKK